MIFIAGYGSLFSAASRARTGVSGLAIPVVLHGYRRAWSARIENLTVLGVERDEHSRCTAVLVPVQDCAAFDEREQFYHRESVLRSQIQPVRPNDTIPPGDVWIYVPDAPQPCSEVFPIALSYIDVIFSGLLTDPEYAGFGHDFCAEFVRT